MYSLALIGVFLGSCKKDIGLTTLYVESQYGGELFIMTLDSLGSRISNRISIENNIEVIPLDVKSSTEVLIQSSLISDHLRLFLSPGDSTIVSIEKLQESKYSFSISGDNSEFQNYLLSKDKDYHEFLKVAGKSSWDNLDSILDSRMDKLVSDRSEYSFSRSQLEYDSLVDWTRTLRLKLKKFQSGSTLDTSRISDLFVQLKNYDPTLKNSSDFSTLLYDLQSLFVTLNQWQSEILIEHDLLALTIRNIEGLKIHPYHLSWIKAMLISRISEYGIDGPLGDEYYRFINSPDNPRVFVNALKNVASIWNDVKAGSDAPDFTLIDQEGKMVKFSDYFGEYLYVDIWAGWCKPCIYEFPFSKKAIDDPRFNRFKFLFINMDRNKETWIQGLERYDPPKGVHLYLTGEWDNELFSKYNPTALPRYMLIDPSGKIINTHAPRPSQPDLILAEISGSY